MSARVALTLALVVILALGVWMRWALAGLYTLPRPFEWLRHAHSHLGYFGLLFPLAWAGWRAVEARTPSSRVLVVYGVATVVATVGFVIAGYGPMAIAGSTVVGGLWIVSAWPLVRRRRDGRDPLATVFPGLLLSFACVPPVALLLRSDPELAYAFVASFLAGLMFLAIVPSSMAVAGARALSWPSLLLSGALAALFLGVWPHLVSRIGLLVFAGHLVGLVRSPRLALHARAMWALMIGGLLMLGLGVLPNTRAVALGATHFLILGPVLATLAPLKLAAHVPPWAWWIGHASWGVMAAALTAQGFGAGAWTWTAAAAAGTCSAVWWILVLATGRPPPTLSTLRPRRS